MMRNGIGKRTLCAAILSVTTWAMATVAWADVTVVSEVTTKGMPKPSGGAGAPAGPENGKPATMTTYYKGDKQRIETGETITINDLTAGKTYLLNGKKKTYTLRSLDKIGADNPFVEMIRMDVSATVTPTDEKKTILDKASKRYDYAATIKTSMDGADEQMAGFFPTITITGQQWTTEDVVAPTDFKKIAQAMMGRSFPPMMAKGMKDLAEKMSAIKGFPLSSVVTVKFIFSKPLPPQAAASMPKDPIITTTEVKSLKETPLDDALFAVPADYSEVKDAPPALGAPPAPN